MGEWGRKGEGRKRNIATYLYEIGENLALMRQKFKWK